MQEINDDRARIKKTRTRSKPRKIRSIESIVHDKHHRGDLKGIDERRAGGLDTVDRTMTMSRRNNQGIKI